MSLRPVAIQELHGPPGRQTNFFVCLCRLRCKKKPGPTKFSRRTGEGVQVVYDGAGADTFQGSLDSLAHHGVLAYYGQTIKRLPPIDLLDLPRSILVTYPRVHDHVRSREALLRRTGELFGWIAAGRLKPHIGHRYALGDASKAHADLAARRTTGKILLLP